MGMKIPMMVASWSGRLAIRSCAFEGGPFEPNILREEADEAQRVRPDLAQPVTGSPRDLT